jgi:hypothetical protein
MPGIAYHQLVCPTVEKARVDFFRFDIRDLAEAYGLEIMHQSGGIEKASPYGILV